MPNYQELTNAVTSLPVSERLHVLQALDASLNADFVQHSVGVLLDAPAASGGSFTPEQQAILQRRAATPPEQYVPWEPARDAMLLRLINAT